MKIKAEINEIEIFFEGTELKIFEKKSAEKDKGESLGRYGNTIIYSNVLEDFRKDPTTLSCYHPGITKNSLKVYKSCYRRWLEAEQAGQLSRKDIPITKKSLQTEFSDWKISEKEISKKRREIKRRDDHMKIKKALVEKVIGDKENTEKVVLDGI